MKRGTNIARTLVLATVICMMLSCTVFAAEGGSVWVSTDSSSTGEGTVAAIVTDTTVSDGLVELTYDPDELTFLDVTVDEAYVAVYAVNDAEAGIVKISWVAPEAYEADGSGICLIQVNFSGKEETPIAITGTVCAPNGTELAITAPADTSELAKAILEAEGLNKTLYTEESVKALEEALENAKAVLENISASQSDIDAAAAALRSAMDALELKQSNPGSDLDTKELEKAIAKAEGLNKKNYTQKSYAAVEKALKAAKAVLADKNATQKEVDDAAKVLNDAIAALVLADTTTPGTGDDNSMTMFIALGAISVVGIIAVVLVLNSKKGRYGK